MHNYLIHANRNHDPKTGQFTNGDGDGDGIIDDHRNQGKDGKKKKSSSNRTITVNFSRRPKNTNVERIRYENKTTRQANKQVASVQKATQRANRDVEIERIRQENKTARDASRQAAKLQKKALNDAYKERKRQTRREYNMKYDALLTNNSDYRKAVRNINKGIKKSERGTRSAVIALLSGDPIGLASSISLMKSGNDYINTNRAMLDLKLNNTTRLMSYGSDYLGVSQYTNAYDNEIDRLKTRGFITNA